MISFTWENILILTVFQLLVSGLIVCGTGAALYLHEDPFVRKILWLLTAAFVLYSLHLLLEAPFYYRSLSLAAPAVLPQPWDLPTEAIETAAFVFLALAYLPQWVPEGLGVRFWAPAAASVLLIVTGLYVAQQQAWLDASADAPLAPLFNAALLTTLATFHLYRRKRKAFFSALPLFVLSVSQLLHAASSALGSLEWLWIAESASGLIGLGLFALIMDSRTDHLQVRFFLRLNLTFVVIASLLILIVAETERREYLGIAESHSEELSEFLRGHLIYFDTRKLQPSEILSRPEIIHKVTSDFGRLPDLRRVRVTFRGWAMEMSLEEDRTVTHEVHPEDGRPRPPKLGERGQVTTLASVPVTYGGRQLGHIELDQGLRSINARVAHQMRIIFITFTVAVFVAAALFGFTVQRAHKTIQGQFEELERTHAQLAHAARLASAGQLAGGVAHEINNPAGIILTTSDYLLRESEHVGVSERLREDLEAIRRQARRISEIVNGLLTFARPAPLDRKPVHLNDVLQQSLSLLAPRFREQHVEAEHRLAENLPVITADPDRLEQVFVNLLNNAADAMPHGGKVFVEGTCDTANGKELAVSVADTGSGIAEEHLKRIFDPFFSTKPKGKGTGLGLSISYAIIRDHGGLIEVTSQPGRGTTFRVLLPTEGTRRAEL